MDNNKDYYKKYLKYKGKYLKYTEKYKLSGGSGIKIKSTNGENKVVDKSWSDGKNKNPITLYSDNLNNPNQTFLMKEYKGMKFITDENNLCISDNGKKENGSNMIMDICNINSPDQQFNFRAKLPDNKNVFENKNKDKCLDSNWNQNLIYWNCDINNKNQQFEIVNSDINITDIKKNTNLRTLFPVNKVDNDNTGKITSHINSKIQNLILAYPVNFKLRDFTRPTDVEPYTDSVDLGDIEGEDIEADAKVPLSSSLFIAYRATELKPGAGTHSEVWCKLIWTALSRSLLPNTQFIPEEWIDIEYNNIADELLSIDNKNGWAIYAMSILTDSNEEFYNDIQNNFNKITFAKAFKIYAKLFTPI